MLFLEDLKGCSLSQVEEHIVVSYEAPIDFVKEFEILIAYESVGNWGCDSASFFLLRHRLTDELYENHGSHCSCYGFEEQFKPEVTTLEYLQSDKFGYCSGGYDDNSSYNDLKIREFLKNLKPKVYLDDSLFVLN